MELFAESYHRYYQAGSGVIGVMADIYTTGHKIELRGLAIYPIGVEQLAIGPKHLLSIRRQIEAELRGWGYLELTITASRLHGANPGRDVAIRRKLG